MPHTRIGIPTLLYLAILMMGAGPAVGDDVRRIYNGATPRDGVQAMVLEELWRVGNEGDGIFFGRVPRVDTDHQGNIYILDSQLCQVHVYSPAGNLLRTVFREGDGPGEARDARDMLLMPDGGIGLVLVDMGIVKFVDGIGDPAGSLRLGGAEGGNYALVSGSGIDGGVVLAGRCSSPGKTRSIRLRRLFLQRCDLSGNQTAVYAENHTVYDFNDFNYVERDELPPFHWAYDVGADGRVFVAGDRNDYEVMVYDPDGTPELVIEREYSPFARTDEDRERFAHMIETSMEGLPFETKVELEDTYPAISVLQRGLQVTSDGSLWVLSGRGLKPETPGIMAVYDVFDPDGVFVRQVALAAPHDAARVGIVLADGNLVIVIEGYMESVASWFGNGAIFSGEEWSTPEVVVYRMGDGK
ncbi:MAG: hypothetical protein KOO60_03685 [Gemmatimonadales bacterium]|nr:hypothetical protein [Gemmatimonadales bacterium]